VSTQTESPAARLADTHAEVQDFYARQMRLLDDGLTDEWAATFTEDGVFDASAQPEPVRTRAAIAAGAGQVSAHLASQGLARRHWLGMVTAQPQPDGSIRAQCYALVIMTPKGGQPFIGSSSSCEDILVREDGDWKVQWRKVVRDDLA
jgi:hypothetical protein